MRIIWRFRKDKNKALSSVIGILLLITCFGLTTLGTTSSTLNSDRSSEEFHTAENIPTVNSFSEDVTPEPLDYSGDLGIGHDAVDSLPGDLIGFGYGHTATLDYDAGYDSDAFKFWVENGDTIRMDYGYDAMLYDADVIVSLHDSEGTKLMDVPLNDWGFYTLTDSSQFLSLYVETANVDPSETDTITYSLHARVTGGEDDFDEGEDAQSFDPPTVTPGTYYNLLHFSDDNDYFYVDVEPGQTVTVTVDPITESSDVSRFKVSADSVNYENGEIGDSVTTSNTIPENYASSQIACDIRTYQDGDFFAFGVYYSVTVEVTGGSGGTTGTTDPDGVIDLEPTEDIRYLTISGEEGTRTYEAALEIQENGGSVIRDVDIFWFDDDTAPIGSEITLDRIWIVSTEGDEVDYTHVQFGVYPEGEDPPTYDFGVMDKTATFTKHQTDENGNPLYFKLEVFGDWEIGSGPSKITYRFTLTIEHPTETAPDMTPLIAGVGIAGVGIAVIIILFLEKEKGFFSNLFGNIFG